MNNDTMAQTLYEMCVGIHGTLQVQKELLYRVSYPGFRDMHEAHQETFRNTVGAAARCQSRLEHAMQLLISERLAATNPHNLNSDVYCGPSLSQVAGESPTAVDENEPLAYHKIPFDEQSAMNSGPLQASPPDDGINFDSTMS